MNKELEALERMGCATLEEDLSVRDIYENEYGIVEQALQLLEAIDNANPTEALECLEKVSDYLNNVYDYKEIIEEVRKDINTIKQALLKAQELEKTFDDMLVYNAMMAGFDYKGKQLVAMPLEEYDDFMKQEKALEVIKKKPCNSGLCINYLKANKSYPKMQDYEHYCMTIREYDRVDEDEFNILKEWVLNE